MACSPEVVMRRHVSRAASTTCSPSRPISDADMRAPLLPLCALLALCACETNPGYSFVSWRVSQPTASTRGYVTEPGFLGFSLDAMGPEHRGMWYGYSIGWTQLEERTSDPFTFASGAAQGLQIRRLDVLPVLAAVQWDLSRHRRTASVQPFVGV